VAPSKCQGFESSVDLFRLQFDSTYFNCCLCFLITGRLSFIIWKPAELLYDLRWSVMLSSLFWDSRPDFSSQIGLLYSRSSWAILFDDKMDLHFANVLCLQVFISSHNDGPPCTSDPFLHPMIGIEKRRLAPKAPGPTMILRIKTLVLLLSLWIQCLYY
jgi:hypothetical protein